MLLIIFGGVTPHRTQIIVTLAPIIKTGMNIDNDTRVAFDKYKQTADKWHDLYSAWVRGIIVVSAGLVSVLVSLRQNKSDTEIEHVLFSATIISLTLCILTGVIVLHRQVELTGKERKFYFQALKDKMFHGDKSVKADYLEVSKLYEIVEYVFYASATISLLALTSYAVLKDSLT